MKPSKHGSTTMQLVDTRARVNKEELPLIERIAEKSLDTAGHLLAHFFSASDDLFYDLSERASTNNEENLYFEAMRAIRIARSEVSDNFCNNFQQVFKNIPDHRPPEDKGPQSEDELAIVDREELEIQLAQKNMADRTRDAYKEELYELQARLNALLKNCEIAEHNNPLDPLQVAQCFAKSCLNAIKLDVKTQLILFKLFEKHFLKQLGHMYFDANQTLVEAGFLPKVPRKTLKDKTKATKPDNTKSAIEAQAKDTATRTEESFTQASDTRKPFQLEPSALASLMASIRAARQDNDPSAEALGNYHYFSANPGTVMPVPELASLLTNSQRKFDKQLSSETPQNLVPQIVTDILALKNPEKPQALEQPDEDIINLVAMFFDKVLEDDNLPIAVQSLICRLQIPVLKVALHDKTFLNDERHPSRLLINDITQAGLSFDESKPVERDPLYRTLVESVQTINHQFKLDNAIFRDASSLIREAITAEAKKSMMVETRTQQTEAGKAKLKAAKTFAQNTLYEKLRDTNLPKVISEFLTNIWLQVLIITFVRKGKECTEWVEYEQLISDLIWVAQCYNDEKSKLRQVRLIPEIMRRIEYGLELVIDNAETRKTKAQDIENELNNTLSSQPDADSAHSLTEEQKTKLGKADPGKKTWEEMTALERQQARYEELTSQFYLQAKNMAEGTWLQYMDEIRGKLLRCKLSKKIDAGNYVFVNRFGFKSLLKTRRQFAYDMQFKKAKVLDTTPMFERLMSKVVSQIKAISKNI